MAGSCPALALSDRVFELILLQLNQAEQCAVQATCKTWRESALRCPAIFETVIVRKRLNSEERLDSLGLWLYNNGRASMVRYLEHHHYDCLRFNTLAYNIFSLLQNVVGLRLVVTKYAKNRRGLPGPVTLSWMPALPRLTCLQLTLCWHTSDDWEVARWAPVLEDLTVVWNAGPSSDGIFDCYTLPPTLRRFTMFRNIRYIDSFLNPEKCSALPNLRSLHLNVYARNAFQWPGDEIGVALLGGAVYSLDADFRELEEPYDDNIGHILGQLTSLTSLSFNMNRFEGVKGIDSISDVIPGPLKNILQAISNLTNLRQLVLVEYHKILHESDLLAKKYFMPLNQLELLHEHKAYIPGWRSAGIAGAFPVLKEVRRCPAVFERANPKFNAWMDTIEKVTMGCAWRRRGHGSLYVFYPEQEPVPSEAFTRYFRP